MNTNTKKVKENKILKLHGLLNSIFFAIEEARMNEKGCIADDSYEALENAQLYYKQAKEVLNVL